MGRLAPWVLGVVSLASLGALAWVFWPGGDEPASSAGPTGQRQTDGGQNGVEFIATYEGTEAGVARFTVQIETHSVDLDAYDVVENVVLDHGTAVLSPSDASRIDSRTSHHISATLYYLTGDTHDGYALTAKDLAGVAERRLEFQP